MLGTGSVNPDLLRGPMPDLHTASKKCSITLWAAMVRFVQRRKIDRHNCDISGRWGPTKAMDFGSGFPEWTELGQDTGLDPLGMQRPIEAIYQSLLPGISTITLRYRYYAFFPWILKYYEDNIRHSDPAVFRVFQRRCELLFALICCRGDPELGIAGSDWAHKKIGEVSQQHGPNSILEFGAGADPDAELSQRYLRNKGGAFGGIYSTQMAEMGLIIIPEKDAKNPIPICHERALPLVAAFENGMAGMSAEFFAIVEAGVVSLSQLDALRTMKPAELAPGGDEHRLLSNVLLGHAENAKASDATRRQTLRMLLELTAANGSIPRAEEVKWKWYEADGTADDPAKDVDEVRRLWVLYQACDLMRLAYEAILAAALTTLASSNSRRLTLNELIDELVGYAECPAQMSWAVFEQQMRHAQDPEEARRYCAALLDAVSTGTPQDLVKAALPLISVLREKAAQFGPLMEKSLSIGEHFQSLRTEAGFLEKRSGDNAKLTVEALFRDRILKRHLWVASRKFRNQKAYTFLMEPDDSFVRYRDHFRVSPSSPRLDQALRFLKDVMLIDEAGLTAFGRAEMASA